MIETIVWFVFAALVLGGGIGMVVSRNPISSLLFLIVSFFGLAAIYALLGAFFISVIQIIVYAGAIMVLFLFVIMLLNLGHSFVADIRKGIYSVIGFVAAGLIGYVLVREMGQPRFGFPAAAELLDTQMRNSGAVGAIALPLYRNFLVPFEITSILLLVAVVGAVILAKRRI